MFKYGAKVAGLFGNKTFCAKIVSRNSVPVPYDFRRFSLLPYRAAKIHVSCHLVETRPRQMRFGRVHAEPGTQKGQITGLNAPDTDGARQDDKAGAGCGISGRKILATQKNPLPKIQTPPPLRKCPRNCFTFHFTYLNKIFKPC